jgi:hypothetical protein
VKSIQKEGFFFIPDRTHSENSPAHTTSEDAVQLAEKYFRGHF